MNFVNPSLQFLDCAEHGPDSRAELFLVEGESAARAVASIRDPMYQAVLAMQGKPINAHRASPKAVHGYPFFVAIEKALGLQPDARSNGGDARFGKVILLFDPDADGIHCGALMMIYFYCRLRTLLDAGRVSMVQAPVTRLVWTELPAARKETFCYTKEQSRTAVTELHTAGITDVRKIHYRGLASIEHESLSTTCVAPQTRRIFRLGAADAQSALAMFGG